MVESLILGIVISFDDAVWDDAARLLADFGSVSMPLLLTSDAAADEIAPIVTAWIDSVAEIYDAEDSWGMPSPGEWACVALAEGVLMQVIEGSDHERYFAWLARDLERHGIDGRIHVWDHPRAAMLPALADFVGLVVCVRGTRVHRGEPGAYEWIPDPEHHRRVLEAADTWCRTSEPRRSLKLWAMIPAAIGRDESASARMLAGFERGEQPELAACGPEEFRAVEVRVRSGRVALILGRRPAEGDWWAAAVDTLVDFLLEHSASLEYGGLRRGWATSAALGLLSEQYDWPEGGPVKPRGIGFSSQAFDDLVAPDAYGIQLLGRAHARLSDLPAHWRQEPTPGRGTLLQHVDRAAWFAKPFVPVPASMHVTKQNQPAPALLVQARHDLHPILDVSRLRDLGYADPG